MSKAKDTAELAFTIAKRLIDKYHFITIMESGEVLYYDSNTGIYRFGAEPIIESETQEDTKQITSIMLAREVIGHIKRTTYQSIDNIDAIDDVINVQNGIVNLESGQLMPHTHTISFLTQLPIKYKPSAECPKIDGFLNEIFADQTELIREFIGYLLIKAYTIHKALMIYGKTHTGKTTFVNLLTRFLGSNNIASISLQELCDDKFAKADLFGKLANISDDIPSDAVKYAGAFKQLTGESTLRAQRKYKDAFNFQNRAKAIFTCNEIPPAGSADDTYYYRWLIVETKRVFDGSNCNRSLIKDLTTEEEISGLLNMAIQYRGRLTNQNNFSYSANIWESMQKYQAAMGDTVSRFLAAKIEMDGDSAVEKDILYTEYFNWCEYTETRPRSTIGFNMRLHKIMDGKIEEVRIGQQRKYAYKGIKLRE